MSKIAKPSHDVERIKNRLAKHLDDQNSKYSVAALIRASDNIRKHLTRDTRRKKLTDSKIVIFDQNQHPAKEQSQTVKIRSFVKTQLGGPNR